MLVAILWVDGALYLAFCGKYGCLYIIISIYVALKGIAALLGLLECMRLRLFTGFIGYILQVLCMKW